MFRAARLAAVAFTVVAASSVMPLAAAAPAQANHWDCVHYLVSVGYKGQAGTRACLQGEKNVSKCMGTLRDEGVTEGVADVACARAAEKTTTGNEL
ncbi:MULTISPECIES: hypothetical protein [Streptomyces]|uniref:Uncharacterized protein n=1 Tax=Streptomyces salyersiae TaxID=3075530 RepID=A0ABU2REA9_9ACTN|nr:hypothetical protein [Streptomyces sp. DSM 41770]MDT0427207.1 hypothetical protein [Streptomyces sp. DSM 41770]